MEPEFDKWSEILWRTVQGQPIAYCPVHHHRLEVATGYGIFLPQPDITTGDHTHLLCSIDNQVFELNGDSFWTMRNRYVAAKESEELKGATYRDLDNIYTPVLKVAPSPKDDRYSVQVEIDETPSGKKLVIYALDRENQSEKTQIFIDPQNDKITFDSNDLHPNMIFSKVIAYFKDGKNVTLNKE